MTVEDNARFRVPDSSASTEGQVSRKSKFEFARPASLSSPIREWLDRRRTEGAVVSDGPGYELSEVRRHDDV